MATRCDFDFALLNVGSSIAASSATMAMHTSVGMSGDILIGFSQNNGSCGADVVRAVLKCASNFWRRSDDSLSGTFGSLGSPGFFAASRTSTRVDCNSSCSFCNAGSCAIV